MKVVVLINSEAGRAARSRGSDLAAELQALFVEAGVDAEVRAVRGDRLTNAARKAAEEGVDAVVAGGGDGTINSVATALVDGPIPLGVLPLGTLNHFAKAIGMPLTTPEAVRVIAAGAVRQVDVGEVNGLFFLNNSSIGVYPAMVKSRDKLRLSFGRSKWLAMFQAALRVFRVFPLLYVSLEIDNERLHRKTPLVFIGNNKYEVNLLSLGARNCLDAGELSVYLANCTTRWAMLKLVARALLGRLNQARDFETFCLSKVEVHTRRRKVSVATDGEVCRQRPPLAYRSRPKALRVIAPLEPAATLPLA